MDYSKYFQQLISILSNEVLQEKTFKLILSSSDIARMAKPGNFVHIRVSQDHYPLLRRAFSIHQTDQAKSEFEILFKVVGKGTEMLSAKCPGDTLDIIGPIGNSFSLPRDVEEIMLVAGGMGIAPLWFLLSQLTGKLKPEKLTFFLGARKESELVYLRKLKEVGAKLVVATDDGSMGKKGLVTEVFLKEIKNREIDKRKLAVYACGPEMMLKRMAQIAKRMNFFCQVSLETHMACGVGACWGCAARQKDGTYKRVCVDGPVFDTKELGFE